MCICLIASRPFIIVFVFAHVVLHRYLVFHGAMADTLQGKVLLFQSLYSLQVVINPRDVPSTEHY